MTGSLPYSPPWGPTPQQPSTAPVTQLPDAVLDFLQHLKDNRQFAVDEGSPPPHKRPFVPISVLRRYLTEGRIRRILTCYFASGLDCSLVHKDYLRVFAILVHINKLPWLRHFLANPRLADKSLPFVHGYDWRPDCHEFLGQFIDAQWQFCAQELETNRLNGDYRIDERVIIPIINKCIVKKGPDSTASVVEIHPDYNNLVGRDEHGKPITNTFFLKTCSAESAQYHYKEVKAYRTLSSEEDILPYLVQFYGSWIQGVSYNLLTEYVGGGTLKQFMDDTETPAKSEHIMRFWAGLFDLTRPLMRIHRLPLADEGHADLQGIHHDIKPDNVLVTERFGPSKFDVAFKLADLGLTDFDYVVERNRNEKKANKNNAGTQMFSPPELCLDEDDLYLQRTIQEAHPSKDIWSLGCLLSEAAVWVVLGKEGLYRYGIKRSAATQKIKKLRDTSHEGCFHNGVKVLEEVLDTHVKIRRERRQMDHITVQVLDLVEDMLGPHLSRPEAHQVYEKSQARLQMAYRMLEPDDENYDYPEIFKTPRPPVLLRQEPPERPPELGRRGLGVTFSPLVHSYPTSNPVASPSTAMSTPTTFYVNGSSNFTDSLLPQHNMSSISPVDSRRSVSIPLLGTVNGNPLPTTPPNMGQQPDSSITSKDFQEAPNRIQSLKQNEGAILAQPPMSSSAPVAPEPPTQNHVRSPYGVTVTPNPSTSTTNGLPSTSTTRKRVQFPEANIEKVEEWIRRTELNNRTPLLNGYDWLRSLNGRDQIFLFDNSGSMKDHWRDALRVFLALGYIVKGKDPDGMEIRTTMDPSFKKRSKKRRPLLNALSNDRLGGQCDISLTFSQILRELHLENIKNSQGSRFLWRKQKVGVNIYILTDGVWEEGNEWLPTMIESIQNLITNGMQRGQLGIQFIQFGNDPTGTQRLQMLDDDLDGYGVKKDFIDTEHATGNVFKMLLGSIDATIDGPKTRPSSMLAPSHSRHVSAVSAASLEVMKETMTGVSDLEELGRLTATGGRG